MTRRAQWPRVVMGDDSSSDEHRKSLDARSWLSRKLCRTPQRAAFDGHRDQVGDRIV